MLLFSHKGSNWLQFFAILWHAVLSSLHVDCRQMRIVLQLMMLQEKLVKPGLSFMHVWYNCLNYNLSKSFLLLFSQHFMLYTFIDILKLSKPFIERHVLSLCILFTMITFAVICLAFFSQSPSFEMCVSLAAISQKR